MTRIVRALLLWLMLGITAGAGCTSDDGGEATSTPTSAPPTSSTYPVEPEPATVPLSEQTPISALPGLPEEIRQLEAKFVRADEYLGLTEQAAIDLADEQSLIARVVYRDEFLGRDDSLNASRVNLYVLNDEVVDARLY
jgi:hypothetical protein